MDDLALARALHVLAVVHWIGGVAMVTWVILPAVRKLDHAVDPIDLFERVEGRFSFQAKISTLLAGASRFYLTDRLFLWDRFLEPAFWWMHAMVAIWAVFTVVLFVAEPLVLHRWFHRRAARDPQGTLRLVLCLHQILLTASLVTVAAAVLGAHGGL